MRHGWGIYLPNGPMDPGRWIDLIGNGCYSVLHMQASVAREIRARHQDALIEIRCYAENWHVLDPAAWARTCWEILHAGADPLIRYTRHMTWANEQNLATESGGVIGATPTREASWSDYQRIAAWNAAWIEAYLKLPDTAADILHYPAMATGHGEDWTRDRNDRPLPGFTQPALKLLEPGIRRCSCLNVHPYQHLEEGVTAVTDRWQGVGRIVMTHDLMPDVPLYVEETGTMAITDTRSPEVMTAIGYYLQGLPYVSGWTPFIADSPDPGHALNNWTRNEAVIDAYSRTKPWRLERPELPRPAPSPAPVPIPQPEPTMPDWYPAAVQKPISVNFTPGRAGQAVKLIVHHIADGLGDPFGWFNTPRGDDGSSAHFWISKLGKVVQYRPLGDTCWANGPVCQPDLTNPVIRAVTAAGQVNAQTVAVEHEGKPGDVMPYEQWNASRTLTRWLCSTYNLPVTRERVVGHYQIDRCTRANCPGPTHPWAAILQGGVTPPVFNIEQVRSQLWTIADTLAANGYPWFSQGLKALVTLSKGEK